MAIQAAQVYSGINIGLGLGLGFGSNNNPLLDGGIVDGDGNGGGFSRDLMIMENAYCGVGVDGFNQFCFNTDQQQRNQNFESMPFSLSMALQADKQIQEIDHYIKLQSERLRLVLEEQRKQQLGMILKNVEIKTSILMRQKDEEIAKATNRRMELEILLKKLEIESQAWRRVAQEKEAMVFSLNNSLEQLKENAFCCFFNNGAEDAESCCDIEEEKRAQNRAETEEKNRVIGIGFIKEAEEETEQEQRKRRKMVMMKMICKGCNSRESCVLFLPCRHLCSCKDCEAYLDSCPVCLSPKKGSMEALIF